MPVYEYLCEDCEGVFEVVRPIKEADEPQPCPVCDTEGNRVMPSAFTAFIVRGGYPRRIPDKGNFWHLGKEVSYLPKSAKPYEHPQIVKEARKDPMSTADFNDLVDQKIVERRGLREEKKLKRERQQEFKARNPNRKRAPRVDSQGKPRR